MQRGDELTGLRRCVLHLMPAPNIGQCDGHAANSLRDGQMAGVTHAATIGVGRPVVVVDLFSNAGGGLETGKEGQQEQYEDCPYQLPSRIMSAHH